MVGFTSLLKKFLFGQYTKTNNLFGVLEASVADVGDGFLRAIILKG